MTSTLEQSGGTRFRLFPQAPFGGMPNVLETVTITTPPGRVMDGPADDWAYTIIPTDKPSPYGVHEGRWDLPPWRGRMHPGARPAHDGHFDHVVPGSLEFEAAHLFGSVRFVLDIWERYLGRPVAWHFADAYDHLELGIIEGWPNAHMGYGYLEVGELRGRRGERQPYSLNFDIIAHEVGHAVLLAFAGDPGPERLGG